MAPYNTVKASPQGRNLQVNARMVFPSPVTEVWHPQHLGITSMFWEVIENNFDSLYCLGKSLEPL